jgi:hypothetical protein
MKYNYLRFSGKKITRKFGLGLPFEKIIYAIIAKQIYNAT